MLIVKPNLQLQRSFIGMKNKVWKYIGIGFGIVVATLFIVPIFLHKEYLIEREILVNKPKDQVFDFIKLTKNHDKFSKWASMDPNMKKKYLGEDGLPGFTYSWDSENKNVGQGEQITTDINPGTHIGYELRFHKPFETKAMAYLETHKSSDTATIVKWGFMGKMHYPMNLMLQFMDMDNMVGEDLSTGLNNLKNLLEKK